MQTTIPILHIDDDPMVTRIIAARLQKYGYLIESLNKPGEWEEAINQTNAGIVLLDCELGTCNGLDLLPKILAIPGNRRVIMLTGKVDQEVLDEATRSGADFCFFKSALNIQELAEAIQTLAFRRLHLDKANSQVQLALDQPAELRTSRANADKNLAALEPSLQNAAGLLRIDGFCEYLLETGRVKQEDLLSAIQLADEQTPKLGQIALLNGKLTVKQIFTLLQVQCTSGELFGQSALRLGFLTQNEVDNLLAIQKSMRPKLLDLLLVSNSITEQTLREAKIAYRNLEQKSAAYKSKQLTMA